MKKISLLLVLTIAFLATACQKASHPTTSQKPIVKIGVILPLSGNGASIGESLRDAITLAQKEIGEQTHYQYEFIFEDNALELKKTAFIVNKLIHVDQVDAILSYTSSIGNIVSPIAQENNILHIGLGGSEKISKGSMNFNHLTPTPQIAQKLLQVLKEKNISKIAFVELNSEGTKRFVDDIENQNKKENFLKLKRYRFSIGERDFRTLIKQTMQTPPQIFFIEALSPEIDIFIRQLRELDIHTPVASITAFGLIKDISMIEGQWFISVTSYTDTFQNKYTKRFNRTQLPYGTGRFYDMAHLIAHAYENLPKDSKPTPTQVAEYLAQNIHDFPSSLGTISISPDGIISSSIYLEEIQNGKPVRIKQL